MSDWQTDFYISLWDAWGELSRYAQTYQPPLFEGTPSTHPKTVTGALPNTRKMKPPRVHVDPAQQELPGVDVGQRFAKRKPFEEEKHPRRHGEAESSGAAKTVGYKPGQFVRKTPIGGDTAQKKLPFMVDKAASTQPVENVVEPWQMTKEQWLTRRGAHAPMESDDFVLHHLSKVSNGTPGLSVEGNRVVYRNQQGQPVGVTTMKLAAGEKVVDDTAVHPQFRRQGIATKLYQKAAELGHHQGWVENQASALVKHKMAVEKAHGEGKQIPQHVLAEYPHLQAPDKAAMREPVAGEQQVLFDPGESVKRADLDFEQKHPRLHGAASQRDVQIARKAVESGASPVGYKPGTFVRKTPIRSSQEQQLELPAYKELKQETPVVAPVPQPQAAKEINPVTMSHGVLRRMYEFLKDRHGVKNLEHVRDRMKHDTTVFKDGKFVHPAWQQAYDEAYRAIPTAQKSLFSAMQEAWNDSYVEKYSQRRRMPTQMEVDTDTFAKRSGKLETVPKPPKPPQPMGNMSHPQEMSGMPDNQGGRFKKKLATVQGYDTSVPTLGKQKLLFDPGEPVKRKKASVPKEETTPVTSTQPFDFESTPKPVEKPQTEIPTFREKSLEEKTRDLIAAYQQGTIEDKKRLAGEIRNHHIGVLRKSLAPYRPKSQAKPGQKKKYLGSIPKDVQLAAHLAFLGAIQTYPHTPGYSFQEHASRYIGRRLAEKFGSGRIGKWEFGDVPGMDVHDDDLVKAHQTALTTNPKGDQNALRRLFLKHRKGIDYIANKYRNSGVPFDDLQAEARHAFFNEAIKDYMPGKGKEFGKFALMVMDRKLNNYARKKENRPTKEGRFKKAPSMMYDVPEPEKPPQDIADPIAQKKANWLYWQEMDKWHEGKRAWEQQQSTSTPTVGSVPVTGEEGQGLDIESAPDSGALPEESSEQALAKEEELHQQKEKQFQIRRVLHRMAHGGKMDLEGLSEGAREFAMRNPSALLKQYAKVLMYKYGIYHRTLNPEQLQLSNKEIAKRYGLTDARMSQIMSDAHRVMGKELDPDLSRQLIREQYAADTPVSGDTPHDIKVRDWQETMGGILDRDLSAPPKKREHGMLAARGHTSDPALRDSITARAKAKGYVVKHIPHATKGWWIHLYEPVGGGLPVPSTPPPKKVVPFVPVPKEYKGDFGAPSSLGINPESYAAMHEAWNQPERYAEPGQPEIPNVATPKVDSGGRQHVPQSTPSTPRATPKPEPVARPFAEKQDVGLKRYHAGHGVYTHSSPNWTSQEHHKRRAYHAVQRQNEHNLGTKLMGLAKATGQYEYAKMTPDQQRAHDEAQKHFNRKAAHELAIKHHEQEYNRKAALEKQAQAARPKPQTVQAPPVQATATPQVQKRVPPVRKPVPVQRLAPTAQPQPKPQAATPKQTAAPTPQPSTSKPATSQGHWVIDKGQEKEFHVRQANGGWQIRLPNVNNQWTDVSADKHPIFERALKEGALGQKVTEPTAAPTPRPAPTPQPQAAPKPKVDFEKGIHAVDGPRGRFFATKSGNTWYITKSSEEGGQWEPIKQDELPILLGLLRTQSKPIEEVGVTVQGEKTTKAGKPAKEQPVQTEVAGDPLEAAKITMEERSSREWLDKEARARAKKLDSARGYAVPTPATVKREREKLVNALSQRAIQQLQQAEEHHRNLGTPESHQVWRDIENLRSGLGITPHRREAQKPAAQPPQPAPTVPPVAKEPEAQAAEEPQRVVPPVAAPPPEPTPTPAPEPVAPPVAPPVAETPQPQPVPNVSTPVPNTGTTAKSGEGDKGEMSFAESMAWRGAIAGLPKEAMSYDEDSIIKLGKAEMEKAAKQGEQISIQEAVKRAGARIVSSQTGSRARTEQVKQETKENKFVTKQVRKHSRQAGFDEDQYRDLMNRYDEHLKSLQPGTLQYTDAISGYQKANRLSKKKVGEGVEAEKKRVMEAHMLTNEAKKHITNPEPWTEGYHRALRRWARQQGIEGQKKEPVAKKQYEYYAKPNIAAFQKDFPEFDDKDYQYAAEAASAGAFGSEESVRKSRDKQLLAQMRERLAKSAHNRSLFGREPIGENVKPDPLTQDQIEWMLSDKGPFEDELPFFESLPTWAGELGAESSLGAPEVWHSAAPQSGIPQKMIDIAYDMLNNPNDYVSEAGKDDPDYHDAAVNYIEQEGPAKVHFDRLESEAQGYPKEQRSRALQAIAIERKRHEEKTKQTKVDELTKARQSLLDKVDSGELGENEASFQLDEINQELHNLTGESFGEEPEEEAFSLVSHPAVHRDLYTALWDAWTSTPI